VNEPRVLSIPTIFSLYLPSSPAFFFRDKGKQKQVSKR